MNVNPAAARKKGWSNCTFLKSGGGTAHCNHGERRTLVNVLGCFFQSSAQSEAVAANERVLPSLRC